MKQRRTSRPRQPVNYPSVPDLEAMPGRYDEPERPRPNDRMPEGNFVPGSTQSLSDLRLRVETLLNRKEAPGADAWNELGDQAQTLLIQFLDDAVMTRNPPLRHRVIATLGQLAVTQAVPRLGEILSSRAEDAITRAAAANAIGRIADRSAISKLARASHDSEAVVRRQVALAFGRLGEPDGIGHLQALTSDASPAVSSAAVQSLRALEEHLGTQLKVKGRVTAERKRKRKQKPAVDE